MRASLMVKNRYTPPRSAGLLPTRKLKLWISCGRVAGAGWRRRVVLRCEGGPQPRMGDPIRRPPGLGPCLESGEAFLRLSRNKAVAPCGRCTKRRVLVVSNRVEHRKSQVGMLDADAYERAKVLGGDPVAGLRLGFAW